jgi:hypothetical protein
MVFLTSIRGPWKPGDGTISPVKMPNVPDLLQPSAEEDLAFVAHASGFQIYVCRAGTDGRPAWVLKAPQAQLFDGKGNVVGSHFAGPTWRHNDGSEIVGKMLAKADAPDPAAIPWLLVKVTGQSGDGAFSRITTIQRVNTVAGLPPAEPCSEGNLEVEFKSEYTADYYFYARRA